MDRMYARVLFFDGSAHHPVEAQAQSHHVQLMRQGLGRVCAVLQTRFQCGGGVVTWNLIGRRYGHGPSQSLSWMAEALDSAEQREHEHGHRFCNSPRFWTLAKSSTPQHTHESHKCLSILESRETPTSSRSRKAKRASMDFRDVCNFFGGTIFSEEYRTDFEENDERIEAATSRLDRSSPLTTRASLLLLKAVNAGMRGEIATAQNHLTELSQLAESSLDERWAFRCRHYEFYILCLQRFPPVLRFRPNDDNDSAIRAHAQLSIVPRIKDLMSCRRLFASSNWSVIDKAESEMIDKTKAFMNELWGAAYRHHPAFPMDQQAEMMKSLGIDLFTGSEAFPETLLELVDALDLPETSGYLKRLAVEHSLGAGLENAMTMSSALAGVYMRREDFIGAANCKLLEADHNLSPPFSSPLALNLIPLDRGLGWDNEIWDATEALFPLRKVEAAERLYQEAFDLFSRGCSRRGQAAIEVRRGCVNHAEALALAHTGRLADTTSLQDSAKQNFEKAKELFHGDFLNLQLVSAHQILLDISVGKYAGIEERETQLDELKKLEERACEIGEWGRISQNFVVCQYIGLLLLRFGRKVFLTSEVDVLPYDKAILCCTLARACFRALQDPLLELYAIVAHAMLHQSLGNSAFAKACMVEGRQILPDALQSLDQLAATCPEDMRFTIQIHRSNRLAEFQSAYRTIYGQDFIWTSKPVSSTPPSFLQMLDFVLSPNRTIISDYNQTLKDRHKALVLNADVETSDGYPRQFLSRWDTSTTSTVPQEVLLSMRLTIYHYLGDFDAAQRILPASIPVIYGGDDSSGFMVTLTNSDIEVHRVSSRTKLAECSISHCFVAKDWQLGRKVLNRIQEVLPGYPNGTTSLQRDDAWQLIVWMACIEEHCGNLKQASKHYLQALDMLETRRQQVADTDTLRDMYAIVHSGEIYAGLARIAWNYARAEVGAERNPHGATWTDQVLLYLEQGRARLLMDVLTTSSGLESMDGALKKYANYISYVRKLDRARNSPLDEQQQIIHELGTDMGVKNATLTNIQTQLENMSLSCGQIVRGTYPSQNTNVLYGCIPDNSICIHINVSRDGMLLLGILSKGIQKICQIAVTDMEIDRAVLLFLKPFRLGTLPDAKTYMLQLRLISQWIIEPMAQIIKEKEHVIFIPSRAFHKFPFSALLFENRPLFLRKSISQAPSLSVLAHLAEKKSQSLDSLGGTVIVRAEQDDSDDGGDPLPMAGMEAINISHIYGYKARNAGSLGSKDFIKLYESFNILHISTYGLQSGKSTWESALTFRERFSVLDLAKLHSKAALIVFAACVSGLGEDTIGNDMLGFSHGVIASGVSAYLGALWNVNDEATMIMMVLFHRALAERSPNDTLAMCWRQAQMTLYGLDNAKAKVLFEEFREVWDESEAQLMVPLDMPWEARVSIDILIEQLAERKIDYTHPYYWAPFVLVGNGGLKL